MSARLFRGLVGELKPKGQDCAAGLGRYNPIRHAPPVTSRCGELHLLGVISFLLAPSTITGKATDTSGEHHWAPFLVFRPGGPLQKDAELLAVKTFWLPPKSGQATRKQQLQRLKRVAVSIRYNATRQASTRQTRRVQLRSGQKRRSTTLAY